MWTSTPMEDQGSLSAAISLLGLLNNVSLEKTSNIEVVNNNVIFIFAVLGKDVGKSVACNHIRAVEYYIESISRDIFSPAYPCKGEQEYLSGKCFSNEQMEYIGFDWSVNNSFKELQVYQVTRKTLPYIGM